MALWKNQTKWEESLVAPASRRLAAVSEREAWPHESRRDAGAIWDLQKVLRSSTKPHHSTVSVNWTAASVAVLEEIVTVPALVPVV